MSYVVLARKYRPQTFEDVVGQEATAETLRNAIRGERVAHAYLFTGPRGVGKTSMARILAKALNCKDGPTETPCNECDMCVRISQGNDIDVQEIDGASNNTVDEIRELRRNVKYAAARSRHKIYVIDEVHMLTVSAFNALLKTLEEPPSHVKFIFATTEPQKIPETIHSRCQRFDFRRVSVADIAKRLGQICQAEEIEADDGALLTIARTAKGGMRDAQSLLDQAISFCEGALKSDELYDVLGLLSDEKIEHLVASLVAKDTQTALAIVDEVFAGGKEVNQFIDQVLGYLRDVMIAATCGADSALVESAEAMRDGIGERAKGLSVQTILYMMQVFADARRRAKEVPQSRVVIEMAMVKLANLEDLLPIGELAAALREQGLHPPAPANAQTPHSSAAPAAVRPASAPHSTQTMSAPEPRQQDAQPTAASPEPAPPKPTGPLSLEAVQAAWGQIAGAAHGQRSLVGSALRTATPVALSNGELTISLASSGLKTQIDNDESKGVVERSVHSVLGHRARIGFVVTEQQDTPTKSDSTAQPQPQPQPPPPSREGIMSDDMVRKAMEIFNGRIVGLEG